MAKFLIQLLVEKENLVNQAHNWEEPSPSWEETPIRLELSPWEEFLVTTSMQSSKEKKSVPWKKK